MKTTLQSEQTIHIYAQNLREISLNANFFAIMTNYSYLSKIYGIL